MNPCWLCLIIALFLKCLSICPSTIFSKIGECAVATSGFCYLVSLKYTYGRWCTLDGFGSSDLVALVETRHRGEGCSSNTAQAGKNTSLLSQRFLIFQLFIGLSALHKPVCCAHPTVLEILSPYRWEDDHTKLCKKHNKKYSAKILLPHFLLSPSSDCSP